MEQRLISITDIVKNNTLKEVKNLHKFQSVPQKLPTFKINNYLKNHFIIFEIKGLGLNMPNVSNTITQYKNNLISYQKDFNDYLLKTYGSNISISNLKAKNISKNKKQVYADISITLFDNSVKPVANEKAISKDINNFLNNIIS